MEFTGDSWQPGRSHNGGAKGLRCVTTRRRNCRFINGLSCAFGALAARFLGLGVLGFAGRTLTPFGLSPCRLPAADEPLAFRIPAVPLVPTARLITAPAPLAQADAAAWPAPTGQTAVCSLNVGGAHGRAFSQGKARGECVNILPGRYPNKPVYGIRLEQNKERDGFRNAPSKKTQRSTISTLTPSQCSKALTI